MLAVPPRCRPSASDWSLDFGSEQIARQRDGAGILERTAGGFAEVLAWLDPDELVVLSTGEILSISDILYITATTIEMKFWPEYLLIGPR